MNMKLSTYIFITFGLLACVADAQDLRALKPRLLRCIPLNLDRPVEPTSVFDETIETIITIGSPGDPFYLVRTDIRTTNLWITADNIEYHHAAIIITDESVLTIGTPADELYRVQTDVVTSMKLQERIIFPNRTYISAETSSSISNGVIAENTFQATKYCYGTKLGTPLSKAQLERLKQWLGIH